MQTTPRSRLVIVFTLTCLACACINAPRASAQPLSITEIGMLPGDEGIGAAPTNQIESHAARGGDQTLVVWTDSRSQSIGGGTAQSGMDIFGIRLDSAGNPIDPAPFAIAANGGWQQAPHATWNGENWLVTFYSQDPTEFYYQNNIRGVRISPKGQVLDPVPLMLADNQQQAWVAGQAGQWLVTWYLPHADLYGMYVVGRRLGGDGKFLDPGPVTLMDWTYPLDARVLAAGGEYLVIGQDWNSNNYKARRVGFDGQPIGNIFTPISPYIGTDGTQYLATWILQSATYKLMCSLMSPDGVLANPAGAQLYSGQFVPSDISISHDETNWFVGWATNQKRVGRVNAAGQVLDPGGVLIPVGTPVTQNTYNFQVVGNASGGALTMYNDYRASGDANVFCIPVGAAAVPGSEFTVSTGTPNQRTPAFAEGPDGQVALAFISEMTGDDRILVYLLSPDGVPTTLEPIVIAQGAALSKPGIAWNGSAYMIVWNDTSVKARRMNPDGTFVDAVPIDVMPGFNVDVAALGDDFCVVASDFGFPPNPQFIAIYYRRIDGVTGTLLDGAPVAVGQSYAYNARIHSDGAQWLAIWERHPTHDDPQSSAQYSFISADGSHTPEAGVNSPFTSSGGQPDVAFSGNHYLFTYRANSLANANNYIAGRVMNANGTWATGLFTIAEAPGRQLRPVVGWDGVSFVVAWDDQRNQISFFDERTDIYGTRVSDSGTVLDPAGFPIIAGPDAEAIAAILSKTNGVSLVASTRMMLTPRFDSYRVGVTRLGSVPTVGDVTGDGIVNTADLLEVINAWGACPAPPTACPADISPPPHGDGLVNAGDLLMVINNWG